MKETIVSTRNYVAVFLTLMVLTAVTVAVAFIDLGPFNTIAAMSIALVKATLVVLFFMHIRYAPSPLYWLFFLAGLFWLALMLVLALSDYLSRGWIPSPSGWR